jgi:hypothetical protein
MNDTGSDQTLFKDIDGLNDLKSRDDYPAGGLSDPERMVLEQNSVRSVGGGTDSGVEMDELAVGQGLAHMVRLWMNCCAHHLIFFTIFIPHIHVTV